VFPGAGRAAYSWITRSRVGSRGASMLAPNLAVRRQFCEALRTVPVCGVPSSSGPLAALTPAQLRCKLATCSPDPFERGLPPPACFLPAASVPELSEWVLRLSW